MTETQILQSAVESIWARANDYYGLSCAVPTVDLSLKGRAAGQACWQQVKTVKHWRAVWSNQLVIRLNLDAYRLDPDDMLSDTIPHEVAHLIVRLLHPKKRIRPHGDEWKEVMRDCFGIVKARRTHQLALPQARRVSRPYLYRCKCEQQHRLTSIRHNKIARGRVYQCRTCKQTLQFVQMFIGSSEGFKGVADE
jgi:SprT protein